MLCKFGGCVMARLPVTCWRVRGGNILGVARIGHVVMVRSGNIWGAVRIRWVEIGRVH